MNSNLSECKCCGKPLSDPVSVELGIGPVCRVNKKLDELGEKTQNMFANRSMYDWGVRGSVLYITDEGGYKSVTNDIENVLDDISAEISLQDMSKMKIMYRDSMGIWDGINVTLSGSKISGVAFFPLTEKDFTKALNKINN
jgi:hypothetical protein